ncbi:hypothetical protein EVG20_g225 [Dentipellis fragilis]|uniref:serine--tRNA ligase n=1 Tax=Dentipellis fragilis TaxID=205917 RepID=A0A4Y9ZFX9_9AGAM|nr:hypothetical protein EVG20_g225 [Dentipellis fragilis]
MPLRLSSPHFLRGRRLVARPSGPVLRSLSTRPPPKPHTSFRLPKPRLDFRGIVDNLVYKSHNAFNRRANLPLGVFQAIERLYAQRKALEVKLNAQKHRRNQVGDDIRKSKCEQQKALIEEAKSLKEEVYNLETELEEVDEELQRFALAVPNDTHPSSPIGAEDQAVTLSTHGPRPLPPSPLRDHVHISRDLNLLDLEAGANVTGSSWYYLLNEAALLETALVNYAISTAIANGFTPVTTPDVVRSDIAQRCGFQPRDQAAVSQMYHIAESRPELVLAGTAEIPLAGMFAYKTFAEKELPRKLVGVGHAFRAEAGARGADTRGLYRVHQFTKVELFAVCEEHQSEALMEEVKQLQIKIFEGLGFPFRVLDMPTEELGASAYRKYDVEAWMPGRGNWGEISSTSNCTDYQARRLHILYRRWPPTESDSPASTARSPLPFAHTLNGTAAAIPRLIVALLENGARFNDADEVVGLDLPVALKPFWLGSPQGIVRWV